MSGKISNGFVDFVVFFVRIKLHSLRFDQCETDAFVATDHLIVISDNPGLDHCALLDTGVRWHSSP